MRLSATWTCSWATTHDPQPQVWLHLQIVQSLRTGGDLSFEEISLVIPFIELHRSFGIEDLDAPQPGCLRAFKTHHRQPSCPGGFRDDVKYIYVVRDPIEVRLCRKILSFSLACVCKSRPAAACLKRDG